MCQSHTHGNIDNQKPVSEVTAPVLEGAKTLAGKEISENLENSNLMAFLGTYLQNEGKRNHFLRLHNKQEQLKYMNRLITDTYVEQISAAYQTGKNAEAKKLEDEMSGAMRVASQVIFGNTPPAKA